MTALLMTATAQMNGTNIVYNTTNPTLIMPILANIPISNWTANYTNTTNYTILHLFTTTSNATSYNETLNQYTIPTTTDTLASTTESTTTTIITDSTTTTSYTTTTTIVAICGNGIQEHDEACDGSIGSCGNGKWNCTNCQCIPLISVYSLEQTTTTSNPISNSFNIENMISNTQDNKLEITIVSIAIVFVIIVLILYNAGKKEEIENQYPIN